MRIVIATCPEVPVPPIDYGGTERRVAVEAVRLESRGHQVTLLCGPGSICPVRQVVASTSNPTAEWEFVAWLRDHRREYDAVVDITRFHTPSQDLGLPKDSPTLAIMTGDPYRRYPHDDVRNRVYVSKAFAEYNHSPNHPVLNNIFCDDPSVFPLGDGGGGFVLYVGTVRPEKGPDVAARACRLLGVPLVVVGPVQDKFQPYWRTFKGLVDYRGSLGDAKWELYRAAAATVAPINWCDAGILTVKESLVVGTPVVACPIGGLMDDVVDCVNGRLVSRDRFLTGLSYVLGRGWDRLTIRAAILPSLDTDKHVDRMEQLIADVAGGRSW